MITKAFILGAGLGTRLRPLTNHLPKPLVPMWGKPLVHHVLSHCQAHNIKSFAINTHHLPDTWEEVFPDLSFNGSDISLFYEETLLETGGGIKNISDWIDDEDILVFNGDIITDIDLTSLIDAHNASGNIATLAVKSSGPNCNIAVDHSQPDNSKNNQIIDIRNALNVHSGNAQFTGIYCISSKILAHIPADKVISIVPAFIELAKQKNIGAHYVDEASWIDIGTIENYREANLAQRTEPLTESNITNTHISEGASIGKDCKLNQCIVWPKVNIPDATVLSDKIIFDSIDNAI